MFGTSQPSFSFLSAIAPDAGLGRYETSEIHQFGRCSKTVCLAGSANLRHPNAIRTYTKKMTHSNIV